MKWEEFFSERPLAVIATVGADGFPHAVPVEVVPFNGSVFVWCHATSAKCRNAMRTAQVAIVSYKGNSGVLVRGTARVWASDYERYGEITQKFLEKYNRTETYGNDALIEVKADRVSSFG